MRQSTWVTHVVSAGVVKTPAFDDNTSRFQTFYKTARRITDFVLKCRPDIVCIEDYTNQSHSHVAFSIATLGTSVRQIMWEAGIPFVNIVPIRLLSFVGTSNRKKNESPNITRKNNKTIVIDWVKNNLKQEFEGNYQEITDMADATVYAVMGAVFFSGHWLGSLPPLQDHQMGIFKNGYGTKNGLLEQPLKYLAINPDKQVNYKIMDGKHFKFDDSEELNEICGSSIES